MNIFALYFGELIFVIGFLVGIVSTVYAGAAGWALLSQGDWLPWQNAMRNNLRLHTLLGVFGIVAGALLMLISHYFFLSPLM